MLTMTKNTIAIVHKLLVIKIKIRVASFNPKLCVEFPIIQIDVIGVARLFNWSNSQLSEHILPRVRPTR